MITSTTPQNPFKLFLKVIAFLLIYFALCIVLHGCASKPIQNNRTIETVVTHKKDSIKTTVINNAVNDTLKIQVPKIQTAKPECDSITKAEVERVLELLNTSKKSGDNETGIYYDNLKNQIIAWQKIAETKNETTATSKEYIYLKGDKSVEYVQVKYIPFWVKILAYLGGVFLVFLSWRIGRIFI
jgi:biopolymer transport protein ExbD